MSNNDLSLIEKFKSLMQQAMLYAQYSHDYIFDDSVEDSVAIAYLNIAASKFAAAESLYYSCFFFFVGVEADSFFLFFVVYMGVMLSNHKTEHSHQWTDIEYNRLKDAFDSSAFAF